MNWHTRQIHEMERIKLNPPSNKPKLRDPKDYHCTNCIQEIGSSVCRAGGKNGAPCKYWTELLAMAKKGELKYQET